MEGTHFRLELLVLSYVPPTQNTMRLALLLLSGATTMQHSVTAAALCWIWITAALNFRAFHVEDPAHQEIQRLLKDPTA